MDPFEIKNNKIIEEMKRWGIEPWTEDKYREKLSRVIFRNDKLSEGEKRFLISKDRLLRKKSKLADEYMKKIYYGNIRFRKYRDFVTAANDLKNYKLDSKTYDYLEASGGFPIRKFFERYNIIKRLGDEDALVFKAERLSDNKILIVKVIDSDMINELKIMETLSKPSCYPFISCYYNNFYDNISDTYTMEIEYIDGTTILNFFKKLKTNKDLDSYYISMLSALKDVGCTLNYIHSRGIIHGDLHDNNIMIDKNNNPIIIDFGTSCFENDCTRLTKEYDVYRLGETFYFLITGDVYDKDLSKLDIQNKQLENIINRMLSYDITAKEICDIIIERKL